MVLKGIGAEDTSDAAISCQQVGPIELSDRIKTAKAQGEVVFKKRTSLVFKSLQVVRFYDVKRNALAYLAYSDKVVEGSPKTRLARFLSCRGGNNRGDLCNGKRSG